MKELIENKEYKNWLVELKTKIKTSQIKAALNVNSELIRLYWEIGKMITEKQKAVSWGSKIIEQTAKDLKAEFVDLDGFSRSNLYAMRNFYLFYNEFITIVHPMGGQLENNKFKDEIVKFNQIVQQVAGQFENKDNLFILTLIPWKHHLTILSKIKNLNEAFFYIKETISNNWSRSILEIHIERDLYQRQGQAVTNFKITLPEYQSDLANEILKDPYNFNFLTLEKNVRELELEKQLVANITQFLLELGKGFAYMGRQFLLKVGTKEYKLDLLFYHVKLKCYIVIELKTKEFEPEFVGKLNFYLSAIDELVKGTTDNSTIGILMCKTKNNLNVEFALKDVNKPIGVSEFTFNELPTQIKSAMPTIEELEQEILKNID